jgi:hypothetical protein
MKAVEAEETRYRKGERGTTPSIPANSSEISRILAVKGRDILGLIGGILSAEYDPQSTSAKALSEVGDAMDLYTFPGFGNRFRTGRGLFTAKLSAI